MPLLLYELPPRRRGSKRQSLRKTLAALWTAVLMAIFLRKIDARSLWQNPLPGEGWLGDRDLRADALRDLRTDENKLSIFEVNEEDGIPVKRIVAAIAAKRDFLAKVDFILGSSRESVGDFRSI